MFLCGIQHSMGVLKQAVLTSWRNYKLQLWAQDNSWETPCPLSPGRPGTRVVVSGRSLRQMVELVMED